MMSINKVWAFHKKKGWRSWRELTQVTCTVLLKYLICTASLRPKYSSMERLAFVFIRYFLPWKARHKNILIFWALKSSERFQKKKSLPSTMLSCPFFQSNILAASSLHAWCITLQVIPQSIANLGATIWHCPICTCSIFVSVLSLLSLLVFKDRAPI